MRLVRPAHTDGLSDVIAGDDIALVCGFASQDLCDRCIAEALDHGPQMVGEARYERGVSFLATYDGGSQIGYYRFYGGPPSHLSALREMYDSMRSISHGVRAKLGFPRDDGTDPDYHLEIFRYTKGTFFQRHTHDRLPQMVGLICLLSKEYQGQGGTIFYSGDDVVETADAMRQGDLVLFPWGAEHEVSMVNGEDRWVALLPYY